MRCQEGKKHLLLLNSVMSACNNNTKLGSTLIPPILFPYWYNFQLFPLNFLWTCVLQNKSQKRTNNSLLIQSWFTKKACSLKKLVRNLGRKTIKKSVSFDSSSYLRIQCSTSLFLLHIFVVLSVSPLPSPIYSSYKCAFVVFSCCLQESMRISN